MSGASLERGKREGQLPLVQVPIVHSARPLSWAAELAKSNEWKSISKLLYISGEKLLSSFLRKTKRKKRKKKTSILQYKLQHNILCSVPLRAGFASSSAVIHLNKHPGIYKSGLASEVVEEKA